MKNFSVKVGVQIRMEIGCMYFSSKMKIPYILVELINAYIGDIINIQYVKDQTIVEN